MIDVNEKALDDYHAQHSVSLGDRCWWQIFDVVATVRRAAVVVVVAVGDGIVDGAVVVQ